MREFYPLFASRSDIEVTDEELRVLAKAIPVMLSRIDEVRKNPALYWVRMPGFLYGWVYGEGFGITAGQLLDQWEQGAFRDGEWFFFGGNCGFSGSYIHGVNVDTGEKKELTTGIGMMGTSSAVPWNYFAFEHSNPVRKPRKPESFAGFMEWLLSDVPENGVHLPGVVPPFVKAMKASGVKPEFPGMEFNTVPSGSFHMGRFGRDRNPRLDPPEDRSDVRFPMGHVFHRISHRSFRGVPVEVPSFQLMAEAVTWAMWTGVTGQFPKNGEPACSPVTGVSWHDCVAFSEILGGMDPDYVYSLPSETQWEYAARAGTETDFPWGNDPFDDAGYSYYSDYPSEEVRYDRQLRRNPWGFAGMWGSNPEWCCNRFLPVYPFPCRNLEYVTGGGLRAIRGGIRYGGFPVHYSTCKPPWFRSGADDDFFLLDTSFRLVRTPKTGNVRVL